MSDNPFSPSWYRVAHLRPRLRNHNRISRHVYRGQISYVLEDQVTGHVYRFTPEAYRFTGLMNGDYTLQEILDSLAKKSYSDLPTQDQIIEMLSQLHTMDALICDVPPDTNELLLRRKKQDQPHLYSQLKKSILFLRFPLFDPEKWLKKYGQIFTFIFTRPFLWLLSGLFLVATIQLALHWHELTDNIFDTLFTRNNLLIIWLIYPLIKTIHEFAHAFAVKKWGGEVHEMGIMFLIFMPVPYVNATASSTFRDKWQRIAVSSAGILAELFLASLALLLWLRVEPGLIRSIAYNIMLIGGFSTLFFNGNPLVRFDGYYVLSDLLELPNLAQRSRSYIAYLFSKYIFGIKDIKNVMGSREEKRWYLFYGPASFLYRLTIYTSIFIILSSKFSVAGAFFGLFAIAQLLLIPTVKSVHKLFTSSLYRPYRARITFVTTTVLSGLLLILSLLPIPYYSQAEGVIWPPDDSIVRMQATGTIMKIIVKPGSYVDTGDILIECEDLQLDSNIELLQSQIKEYQLKKTAAFATDPYEANIIDERLKELTKNLGHKLEEKDKLTLRSPSSGQFIVPDFKILPGRFLKQGDTLAYVLQTGNRVRAMVPQENIDIISGKTTHVELVILSELQTTYNGRILTDTPQATLYLPNKVLGSEGGGKILTDPEDNSGQKMLKEMFQLDIAINTPIEKLFVGSRVLVRFQHGNEPLFTRWNRKIRQLFLTHFHA